MKDKGLIYIIGILTWKTNFDQEFHTIMSIANYINDLMYNGDEWLFEYGKDGESYTNLDFSGDWVSNYLQNTDELSLYCCLYYKRTEESIWICGVANALIIEAHLILNEKIKGYVLQIKDKPVYDITINNLPDIGEKMTFPVNEVFNSKEAQTVLSSFYKDKSIPATVTLLEKSYVFPRN